MKFSYTLTVCLALTVFTGVQAQENFTCGAHHKMAEVYQNYPGLEEDHMRLLENSRTYYTSARGDREEVYIIPVVFHVIHEYGEENISDAQIYNQMEILNQDFRKQNADTSEIVDAFKALAADSKIEFRLASIDPFGNCTNGIEHIYSHETNIGDDASKLNQWPRSRYLNVWIVKSMENGVAGYAYYPSAVSSGLYYSDGIIIRHNFIGSIGTSSVYTSRALTHEIGHYLGLPHTWGSTNEPEVSCGDDGIQDTPETAGHASCILIDTDNCNSGTEENVQNYMEYSYCSRMYTPNQVGVMRTVLEDMVSSRDNLWTATNHTITGIDVTAPLCAPMADFSISKPIICAGQSVTFNSASWRAPVDTYSWHFPGGTPEFSSDVSPTVTYNEAGTFSAELTVTNSAGSEVKLVERAITVQGDWFEYLGPRAETFESGEFAPHWIPLSPHSDDIEFKVSDVVGYSGNHSAVLEYYKPNLDPILDLNYYQRLGGSKQVLVTPIFNLNTTSSATLNFKFAHATTTSGIFESDNLSLKVYYSTNCGASWSLLQNMQGMDLLTAGYDGGYFIPDLSEWRSSTINLPAGALSENTRFKFEFTAADFSNNFYLDDIDIDGILLTDENNLEINSISIYPNPVDANSHATLIFSALYAEPVQIEMHDILGNLVFSTQVQTSQGENKLLLPIDLSTLSKGVYTVTASTSDVRKMTKLIIQ